MGDKGTERREEEERVSWRDTNMFPLMRNLDIFLYVIWMYITQICILHGVLLRVLGCCDGTHGQKDLPGTSPSLREIKPEPGGRD